MGYIVVIPARYKSTRLKGKPLIDLNGVPMIIRTYRQCLKAVSSDLVYVATDNERIKKVCEKFSAKVLMTSKKHKMCMERVVEASKKVKAKNIITVQGDEPLITPRY